MNRRTIVLLSLAALGAAANPAEAESCQDLVYRYQWNNYAWWWGALGHCKKYPGGPTAPADIFTCAWHQIPLADQQDCLRVDLQGARNTANGIDIVAAHNGKPTCAGLVFEYTRGDFAWWRGAIQNCQRTGMTEPLHIFQCAFAQVPAVAQQECLKETLAAAPVTKAAIDAVVAANTSWTCAGMISRYQWHDHDPWRRAFASCKTGRGGLIERDQIVACAVQTLPPPDQADACLMRYLDTAAITTRLVAEVRSFNGVVGAVADHVSTAWFNGPEPGCELPKDGSIPPSYFEPLMPLRVGDSPVPFSNEGRLRADLRLVARIADPHACALPLAAHAFAAMEDPANAGRIDELLIDGRAYADLAVTGRKAFDRFKLDPPAQQSYCADVAQQPRAAGCPAVTPVTDAAALKRGCEMALRRSYQVANYLRTGQVIRAKGPWWTPSGGHTTAYDQELKRKQTERDALRWIAVSGEDDLPHRPVNVPSSDFPQFEATLDVPAPLRFLGLEQQGVALPVPVTARFVIAHAQAAELRMPPAPEFALRDELKPSIPAGVDVLFFVHGMDSKAEEANDITRALFTRMHEGDRDLVVVAMDLPSSGYTQTLDYDRISPLNAIGVPFGNADFAASGRTPLLDFMEESVVKMVGALDDLDSFPLRIKAVMGGSLGGNLTFRLGRRPNAPWLENVVAWSPASIWNSMGDGSDLTVHTGPRITWFRAQDRNSGDPLDLSLNRLTRRSTFFVDGWDSAAAGIVVPVSQPLTWFSETFQCRKSAIIGSRLDRHETYDPLFLSWRWRLAAEQLLYSHQTVETATGLPRYMANDKRMLLACGFDDHVPYNHICPSTSDTAQRMTLTPGEALILDETGHAVDNERPHWFAGQIDRFLGL